MTQRLLGKLDALEQYSRKRLARHGKIESPGLGKLQLKPFVTTPLTFEFKEDYEIPSARTTNISRSKPAQQFSEDEQFFRHQQIRLKSVVPRLAARKSHSGKLTARPFSAPDVLQAKACNQKDNLHMLKEGFISLKLNQKEKPVNLRTKVHRRPKWKTEVENVLKLDALCQQDSQAHLPSTLDHMDISHWCPPKNASNQNEESFLTALKGDKIAQYSIYGEAGKFIAQQLERDNTIRVCVNGLKERNEASLKESVLDLEETKSTNNFHVTKSASEEKKNLISLSIEDEMEKTNAKIISVGAPKPKSPRPVVKVSETYPIIYAEEGYMQNFILKRWLRLHGNKVSCDLENENDEVQTNPNSVLQNNFDYALALSGKEEKSTFNVTAKGNKKLKRTLSGKQKINIHILSPDGKSKSIKNSQKEKILVQKIAGSFHDAEVPISKLISKDRNVSATKAECNPDGLVIFGVNPKAAAHQSTKINAATVAKFHGSYRKPLFTVSQLQKKGRLADSSQLDYISITKPIKIHDCPNVNSQSFHKISYDHWENKSIIQPAVCFKKNPLPSDNNEEIAEVTKSARCSQPAFSKEEKSTAIKLNNEYCTDNRKSQEWVNTVEFWSTSRSSALLKDSYAMPGSSPEIKKAMLPECLASLPVNFNHPIISIPTA
ncbi:uncharacterized protein C1orf141 homolog [Pelodiscus sinensis]|uniref:uncharacterized protein C1orf141 homolog n=1 Tax=Pelodiscus sinensis TaxID=13735 RepID=UPI000D7208BD|nr:uncharacterized protein LOC112546118 [Pelodiscus sinensis]XP_025041408.1 uncharacterized protein LOC112546118 [Pelodiscus sinensis]XP_025041409.1 uncharacterized protein LOC112546118 [Pelodiscus sinensis]XP_025041410.1 uncharacterized protein LOC112546118 [Pelodiscus sinensis]XP_025041411.1 uncharacterized protein LOC112546118 [Pelodiscus sinensis]XP_025041412.1 uncharacterized protein LOC112546118 [Pelodiscus sinensis]XP_025041413.1 uncharacterized protein LOC112546118 [Pelodiscus sinensi|eukprot:XP_025041407.1 uncharacterized protein LOC112546118 [Pelodiscus sinensis]